MMDKPDDIPADVWRDIGKFRSVAVPFGHDSVGRAIARAIMAERERCAKVAETHSMRFAGQTEQFVRKTLATAIRKGGAA